MPPEEKGVFILQTIKQGHCALLITVKPLRTEENSAMQLNPLPMLAHNLRFGTECRPQVGVPGPEPFSAHNAVS